MEYLLARGVAEARLYVLLHPCDRCGETEFDPDWAPGADGAELLVRYAGNCPNCGVRREFTFRMLGDDPGAEGDGLAFGGERPSVLIDPGEWLWFADRLAASVPGGTSGPPPTERDAAVEDLRTAAAAVDEALKFVPTGEELVPFSAFVSDRGRSVYAEEPGRFRRVRLENSRDELRRLADETAAPDAGTPRADAAAAAEAVVLAEAPEHADEPPADFRIAEVFDATAMDGSAVMGPSHERIADIAERERLLAYLRGAPIAIFVPSRDADRYERERGRVVPMSFRTDGTWVWSDALAYYLEQYAFAPEPALRRHIADRDYQVPEVPADVLLAASLVFGEPGQ
ncbi:MAG TPA: hypothetical protein VGN37_08380 [Actinocatenispora sp.]